MDKCMLIAQVENPLDFVTQAFYFQTYKFFFIYF